MAEPHDERSLGSWITMPRKAGLLWLLDKREIKFYNWILKSTCFSSYHNFWHPARKHFTSVTIIISQVAANLMTLPIDIFIEAWKLLQTESSLNYPHVIGQLDSRISSNSWLVLWKALKHEKQMFYNKKLLPVCWLCITENYQGARKSQTNIGRTGSVLSRSSQFKWEGRMLIQITLPQDCVWLVPGIGDLRPFKRVRLFLLGSNKVKLCGDRIWVMAHKWGGI